MVDYDDAADEVLEVQQAETEVDNAARIIQKAWRRFIDKLLFRYYKELINFKGKGEPRILMKSINPIEAAYLDAAAGVHIRFRLGGESFPPDIYYKIFTHRPIVDICANSPKNYTNPAAKQQVPRQLHNRWEIMEDDQSGWYKRVEMNGWRRLSHRIILKSVYLQSKENAIEFHHSKRHRREEMQKQRKDKKIKWMQMMYHGNMLEAQTTDPFIVDLVQNATIGLMNMVEKEGYDTALEWEVDELLEWTNALNFEEYLKGWKDIGRSNKSENFKGSRYGPIKNDPDVIIKQANPNFKI
uniref:Uncharacterized protein n=2 Tax=Callorhinchus milii TaxID=7868 RepID=A0A4W3ID74_CALMI